MLAKTRLHTSGPIRYTFGKEDGTMKTLFQIQRSSLKALRTALFLALLLTVLFGASGLAQGRGQETYDRWLRILSAPIDYQALYVFMRDLDEGAQEARDAFLLDPIVVLENAGLVIDTETYQLTVLDIARGRDLDVYRISPSRDIDRPVAPPCVGLRRGEVGVGIQEYIDEPFEGSVIDHLFVSLLGSDDAVIGRMALALTEILEVKSVNSADREEFRKEATAWFREQAGINIDRLTQRLFVFDLGLAAAIMEEQEGLPLFTESPIPSGDPVSDEFIGFFFEHVGLLIQQRV